MPDASGVIGPYRILDKLGEGGMGVVFTAVDERDGRRVALKTLRHDVTDESARKRFLRETRLLASVDHPRVCRLHDAGEHGGEPYLVMELLTGEPLAARMSRGPVDLPHTIAIMEEVLDALAELHRHGLVHRDLKPSNVFLTEDGVKLLDLGLARSVGVSVGDAQAAETQLTSTGVMIGTPRYMAPEQVQAQPIDHRADLFSAGALLYEMLSGQPAFGGTLMQSLHAVCFEMPPSLSGSPAVSAVGRVALRALAKRRDDRYATAVEMAEELRGIALCPDDSTATVVARPMSRLMVLPFRMLRADLEIDFLSAGLADAIASSLAALESLVVRSSLGTPPDADPRTIAAKAEVDLVLIGSILRAGDRLRVTSQLVDGHSGKITWTHTAQESIGDLFQLQDDLTDRIVKELALPLSDREQRLLKHDVPRSATAHEYYLKGLQQGEGASSWRVARELFARAADEDPQFAPAWARLARCHYMVGKYAPEGRGDLGEAEKAVARALELNPDLPLAHNVYTQLEVSLGRPQRSLARILSLLESGRRAPELFAAAVMVTRYCGLLEESVAAHVQARRLDPTIATSVGHTYYFFGDYQRSLEASAGGFAYLALIAMVALGQREEVLARCAELERGELGLHQRRWIVSLRAELLGQREECLAALDGLVAEFRDPEGFFYAARAYARLGESERALEALHKSSSQGFFCLPAYTGSAFEALRGAPEFGRILADVEERHREAAALFTAQGGEKLLAV